MKRTAFSNARGFSTLQLVITVAVMMIVSGFAVVGITRARDHVRLMNSARQFAAYVERARADAVRRHGNAQIEVVDNDTYAITMDWDGFGTTRVQNFDLQRGVVFTTIMTTIQFNWRGRIAGEQSFGFAVNRNTVWEKTVSVGVTGSGDVTFDAEYFFDSQLPPVTTTGTGGGVLPEPGASPGSGSGSPSPSPSPGASPTASPGASPTPTANPSPTPTSNPSPTPTATPTAQPTATPTPTPTATPTPQPCVLNAPNSLTIVRNGSTTVSVNRTNVTGTGTITATSSSSGQIQVAPTSRSVNGTAAGSFTVTVKKQSGSVTFASSGCTSKTVGITVK
ncbi:MAG: pilus assembly FimT family protein [Acidobacteriota bacterium]